MSTLAVFLFGVAGSLARRVLFSLGFGVVSFAAISSALTAAINLVTSNYNAVGSVPLALLNLAGAGDCFGILIAAVVTRVSMMTLKKLVLQ